MIYISHHFTSFRKLCCTKLTSKPAKSCQGPCGASLPARGTLSVSIIILWNSKIPSWSPSSLQKSDWRLSRRWENSKSVLDGHVILFDLGRLCCRCSWQALDPQAQPFRNFVWVQMRRNMCSSVYGGLNLCIELISIYTLYHFII